MKSMPSRTSSRSAARKRASLRAKRMALWKQVQDTLLRSAWPFRCVCCNFRQHTQWKKCGAAAFEFRKKTDPDCVFFRCCTCMHLGMHVHVHVCMHTYTHIYACVHAWPVVLACICVCTCMCMYTPFHDVRNISYVVFVHVWA